MALPRSYYLETDARVHVHRSLHLSTARLGLRPVEETLRDMVVALAAGQGKLH